MARLLRQLSIFLAVACLAGCAGPQEPPALPAKAELQAVLDAVRDELGAPGAILAVDAGQGAVVVASGVSNRETGRPMAPDDPYFQGSIAKTYTAVTVLRLAEDGKLSLEDRLTRYVPDFPGGEKVTLRHLLAHTSGLKDFYMHLYYRPGWEEMFRWVTKEWTEGELLELSARFGYWFEPGTDWDYSNTNYYLLGVIAERAGGEPLTAAYRRYLYQPLGLRRTWVAWHEPAVASWPTGYLGHVEGWPHSAHFTQHGELGATTDLDHSPVEWGAGGVVAPAAEATRFLHGLMGGKLLKPETLAAMTEFRPTRALGAHAPSQAQDQGQDGYGLGLVRMERAGLTLIGHGGLFTGHTAGLWHLPEHDLTIALYFNRGFVDQRAALDRILPVIGRTSQGALVTLEGQVPADSGTRLAKGGGHLGLEMPALGVPPDSGVPLTRSPNSPGRRSSRRRSPAGCSWRKRPARIPGTS
ncbi:MAG: serine hydrolase domain-containing protein [Thermoanaerobaculia bacterium]|nr:serine hydrolase domain-containing protein [Thermoanaerobaculia bacterium]